MSLEEDFLQLKDAEIEQGESPLSELAVIYIHYVGKNSDGLNVYHFLLSEKPEEAAAEGWYEVPACNEPREVMKPESQFYSAVKEWKTNIKLDLAQDNCCFSFQDCRDHIFALGFENISEYEEYPDPVRLVFYYGEPINDIDADLASRDEVIKWLPKQYIETEK